jgi:hypothetical protein
MTLEQARASIGEHVVYRPRPDMIERGEISGVGALYVFVRYDGEQYGKATPPEWLELV